MPARGLAHAFEVAGRRGEAAGVDGGGLEQDGGVGVVKCGFEGVGIAPVEDREGLGGGRVLTDRTRPVVAGPGGDLNAVGPAVIIGAEFYNFEAAGAGASDPQRELDRFGAGADEGGLFGGGDAGGEEIGELGFGAVDGGGAQAALEFGPDGVEDRASGRE